MNVSDVNQTERGRVFEQQAQEVAALQNAPAVAPFVTQAAILLVSDVQTRWVVGDFEVEAGGSHKPREIVELHPRADRALFHSLGDRRAAIINGSERTAALAALPFDLINPAELVEQFVIQPALPGRAQCLRRRAAERLPPGFGQS